MSTRQLIVNADDFGQSRGINRGIVHASEDGIVTSASLMVRWPAVAEAAAYTQDHPKLSVGLHLDLGEWIFRDGSWEILYEVVPQDNPAAVEEEIHRQLEMFRTLVKREPTHVDSHQHVHRDEPVHSIIVRIARTLGIPCRGYSRIRYCGGFYGQSPKGDPFHEGISVDALLNLLTGLPSGITELGCHPGLAGWGTELTAMYIHEREQEVIALCDPRVREMIARENISLCSFREVPGN